LEKLSQETSVADLIEPYSHLTQKDIFAALSYASAALSKEELLVV